MFGFWLVYSLIAMPCIFYTGYALTAHTECPAWLMAMVYILLTTAWFSMAVIWNLRTNRKLSPRIYAAISHGGYFMLGFAFLLLCALGIRDTIWLLLYTLAPFDMVSPFEATVLIPANLWTLGIVCGLSIYAVWCALQMPRVLSYHFADPRIRQQLKILVVSDLHINQTTSPLKVRQFMQYFNALQADVVVLAGDITDDFVQDVGAQLRELKKLRAPLGIYVSLGNHEIYYNALEWESVYASLGWQVLHNSGIQLENTGIYLGGVPSTAGFRPNPAQALQNATASMFKILIAHEPSARRFIGAEKADVQVSGHTHGGQIFPFHFPVKWGNSGFVGGAYQINQSLVLVSNGARYWGPPMRLLAPSDVILIQLAPQIYNS